MPQAPTTTQSGLDFDAVLCIYEAISRVLPETPAWSYPLLNTRAEVEVTVRHENIQSTDAFKVRGEVALMAVLSPEEQRHGVVTASTGNHAQSLTWAGVRSEVPVTVIVPVDAPARKAAAVRTLGARVIVEGETMYESLTRAGALTLRKGMRMVSPGDKLAIVLGYTTVCLKLFRHHLNLEVVYAPVSSSSGTTGACLVRDALAPGCRIIGIQSSAAPVAHRTWTSGEPATVHSHTRVVGLAVGASFTLTRSVLGRSLDGFVLVDDNAIRSVVSLLATHVHTPAEGVGAVSLVRLMADPTHRNHCAVACTSGNAGDYEPAGISTGISTRTAVGTDTTLNCQNQPIHA